MLHAHLLRCKVQLPLAAAAVGVLWMLPFKSCVNRVSHSEKKTVRLEKKNYVGTDFDA